jgi:glycylpeptide N-tetradecanoyltransferase
MSPFWKGGFYSKKAILISRLDETIDPSCNEAIKPDIPIDRLRHEPYSLPQGFNWDTVNLDDPLVVC